MLSREGKCVRCHGGRLSSLVRISFTIVGLRGILIGVQMRDSIAVISRSAEVVT